LALPDRSLPAPQGRDAGKFQLQLRPDGFNLAPRTVIWFSPACIDGGSFLETFRWIGAASPGASGRDWRGEAEAPNQTIIKRIQRDYLIMFLLLVAAFVISVAFRTDLILQLWLIPMVIGWAPIHALIELPEHWG
jgi:hypothetical protein